MKSIISWSLAGYGRTMAAFVGSLLAALMLQLGLLAGPAEAHTPTISADASSVSVDEGRFAQNAGNFCTETSTFHPHNVFVSASRGNISQNSSTCGRWFWDYFANDGPFESGSVTVTARTDAGETRSAAFNLEVRNVPPEATFSAPASVDEGKTFTLSLTNPFDPSSADRSAGFTYAFDCGDGSGYGAASSASSTSCKAGSGAGSQTVKGKIFDKDNGAREHTRPVTVVEDTTRPSVEGAAPSGEGVSPTEPNISATFSEEMNSGTLTTSTAKLYQKKGKKWRLVADTTVSCDTPCSTVTLRPSQALAVNKRHKVVITTGAKDPAGNALAKQYSWTFKTASS